MESLEVWLTPAILIGGFLFLCRQIGGLRRDVGDVRERLAKLEGLFEGFIMRARPEPVAD